MEIVVTMEKMLKGKPESHWYYFLAVMGGDGAQETSIVCKGNMSWQPQEMETLALAGDFVEYKGERQFKFMHAKLTLPLDPRGQLHYVCTRSNGIGPVTEQNIWNAYGKEWRNLQRGEIGRMSDAAYDEFIAQIALFEENSEKAEIISFLENKGCSTGMAGDAYEKWRSDTPGVVSANCYALATLPGYSFKTVDGNIRRSFNIGDDDPRRLKSAIEYALEQETESGATAADCAAHLDACFRLLPDIGREQIVRTVKEMERDGEIHLFRESGGAGRMALKRDFLSESIIFHYIEKARGAEEEAFRIRDTDIPDGESFTPDETQLDAVEFAIRHRCAIINGGAGVGKTTVVKMIVRGLELAFPRLSVRLCAPTGKAAARLKEASGIEATTIHVMLGAAGNERFTRETLERTAVIIDEASMVDSALLAEIIKRNPARLILVGDQAQLTPVGRGQPFHDIIETAPEIVRTLTKCYRNTEAVFQAASKIRNGNLPPRFAQSENEIWRVVPSAKPEEAQDVILAWAEQNEIDFESDIVLCPKNGKRNGVNDNFQEATVNALNRELLRIDREKRGASMEEILLPGDRVINTKNMPDAQVWNGTTGSVHSVSGDKRDIAIRLDVPVRTPGGGFHDIVHFDREMAKNLQYAYALTVHKSQGSQYRKVFLVILARDAFQLDRSMIYTGVTRTKKECVIVGDYNTLARGIGNVRRKTTVMQCLRETPEKEK